MVKDFAEFVKIKIDEQVMQEMQKMAQGQCVDFPSYRNKVGVVAGLVRAIDIVTDAQRNYLEDDDG